MSCSLEPSRVHTRHLFCCPVRARIRLRTHGATCTRSPSVPQPLEAAALGWQPGPWPRPTHLCWGREREASEPVPGDREVGDLMYPKATTLHRPSVHLTENHVVRNCHVVSCMERFWRVGSWVHLPRAPLWAAPNHSEDLVCRAVQSEHSWRDGPRTRWAPRGQRFPPSAHAAGCCPAASRQRLSLSVFQEGGVRGVSGLWVWKQRALGPPSRPPGLP